MLSEKRQQYLKKWREKNKETIKINAKQYYNDNKKTLQQNNKQRWKLNKESYSLSRKKWGENNKEYISQKNKKWYEKNKDEYNKNRKEKRKINPPIWDTYQYRKEYLKKWQREKRKKDLLYRINSNISRRIRKDLKRFNTTKKESTQNIVKYSMTELKMHIEKQFKPDMNWANMGTVWEIDHSTPVSWATNESDLYNLWDISNLHPMFINENREKQNMFSSNLKTTFSLIGR